jgi:hypothetical protein
MLTSAIATIVFLSDPGSWRIDDQRSALDGARSLLIGVESSEPLRNTAGLPEKALLTLNCVNGRQSVAVMWPAYLGNNDPTARWRFDEGEIEGGSVAGLRGGAGFVLSGRPADRFIEQVGGTQRVVLQVSGYTGQQEAVFDLEGGAEVATMVREACSSR